MSVEQRVKHGCGELKVGGGSIHFFVVEVYQGSLFCGN